MRTAGFWNNLHQVRIRYWNNLHQVRIRYWNNLHQVRSKWKDWKAKYFKRVWEQ